MPTPDASQFIQMKKMQAVQGRRPTIANKIITHLYQPVITTTGLTDFLPSFSNKVTDSNPRFIPRNRVTGVQAKPKVPGGRVWGA